MLAYFHTYEGCLESIQPFWISREPVAWPGCNLTVSQMRPDCASVNSRSPVGLVSRQWDAVDWACVMCDRHIHNDRESRSASSRQGACPFYSSRAGFSVKATHQPDLSASLQPRFGFLRLLAFPKGKIAVEREEICECDGHTVHKLSQRRFTADWLAPLESDCSRMDSKFSSDWLPSYIKATRPVLEIFKMTGYFPDSPCRPYQVYKDRHCKYKRNTEARYRNHCYRGSAISIRHFEDICGHSYPACKAHTPYYVVICGVSGCTIIFGIILQTARFWGKKLLKHKKCVFVFSTSSVWKFSHYKKNPARYFHKCT